MLITTGGFETITFVKIFTFFVYKLFFQKLQILRYLYFYWVLITFSCCCHINIAEFLKEKERLVWLTRIFTEKEKYITKMIWWITFFSVFFFLLSLSKFFEYFLLIKKIFEWENSIRNVKAKKQLLYQITIILFMKIKVKSVFK